MKKYPIHPLAEMLPRRSPAEREALRELLRVDGQQDPVILLDGQILDGRERQELLIELKQEIQAADFKKTWGSPLRYVLTRANQRTMSESQKACAAVNFLDAMDRASPAKGGTSATEVNGKKRDIAAGMFGVSARYIQDARWLRSQDRKAFQSVFSGILKLSVAKRAVHRGQKRDRQAKRISGPLPIAGRYALATGDNVDLLPTLPRSCARLVVADPKYNLKFNYDGKGEADDDLPTKEYLARAEKWVREVIEVLTPDGTLCIVINWRMEPHYFVMLERLGLTPRASIVWFEAFGVNCASNFNRCHRHILYFTKDAKRFVFNEDAFNRPSKRQTHHDDKRANPDGKLWDDVWGIELRDKAGKIVMEAIPRLVENSPERLTDFPTQLPLKLIAPLVAGFTEPGDLVVDPFNGSGTSGVAAVTQGRDYIGFDISKKYIAAAHKRLSTEGLAPGSVEALLAARKERP